MPLTKNTPKPLLDLGNGKTLLEEQLERIKKSSVIDNVVLVVGYLADQIEAKAKTWKEQGIKVVTVYNPFYETSNNLISLWMAKNYMDEDFIIVNGDDLIEQDVFRNLVKNNHDGIFLTISRKEKYGEEDMKVLLKNKEIVEVSKLINVQRADAESVGLVLVSGQKYRNLFKQSLELLATNRDYINKFWLEVFNLLSKSGIPISSFEIENSKWLEVDFHPDLDYLKSKMQKLNNL